MSSLVRHCFTTRRSGVSAPPRDTFNLALHVDDDEQAVLENRKHLATALGFDPLAITAAEQVHGKEVAVVKAEDAGCGAVRFSECILGVDALITNAVGPVLALFYADCVPVFIVDPVNRAIGLAHAGWKGTALGISAEIIQAMQREYGTDPSKCLAAIGPGIGRCCYDVSHDVAERVLTASGDQRVIAKASQTTWRLDLKLANWFILRSTGIPESSIAMSDECTSCNSMDFFSYRRDGQTGRMAAILALR